MFLVTWPVRIVLSNDIGESQIEVPNEESFLIDTLDVSNIPVGKKVLQDVSLDLLCNHNNSPGLIKLMDGLQDAPSNYSNLLQRHYEVHI